MSSKGACSTAATKTSSNASGVGVFLSAKRILLVDDDRDFCDSVGDVLEDAGYSVTFAHHGADALIKLSQLRLPQLVLLDWSMPHVSGQDFLREVLKDPTYSRIPVIVVSGAARAREEAAALGADGYLEKPVAPADLLRAVEMALRVSDAGSSTLTESEPSAWRATAR